MLPVILQYFFRFRRLFALCACILPAQLLAQAGSGPALMFDSPDSFYHSIAAGTDTAGNSQAVVPQGTLLLPDSAHYLLWVDLGEGQLNVLERIAPDSLVLLKQIPVSIGKKGIGKLLEGDQKTPVGVYRLTSFLPDGQLDDFYGQGAYPISYPNALDAMQGHTGYGIWLHGLPKNMHQRPLLDSDGCIVIDNESLLGLNANIVTGETLIIMSPDSIRWVAPQTQKQTRESLQAALNEWKQAWESKDNQNYLKFYAADFTDLYRNKEQWSSYKTRVNNSKQHIALQFSSMSMLADPVYADLVTVRYFQHYSSDDYNWSGWKEQIWRNTGSGWQILYEGNG